MMKLGVFMEDTLSVSTGAMKIPIDGIIAKHRGEYNDMLTKGMKFSHTVYRVSPGNRIMVHVKVPSGTVKDFHYDVLLQLSGTSTKSIQDYDVRVFSNSPSFVYSVAYIFAHWEPDKEKGNGMMIDTLKNKIPRDRLLVGGTEKLVGATAIKQKPVTRNPMGIPLFDKSLYLAIFHLEDKLKLPMSTYKIISDRQLIGSISDFETLMKQRGIAAAKQAAKKLNSRSVVNAKLAAKEESIRKYNGTRSTFKPTGSKKSSGFKSASSTSKPRSSKRT